MTQIVQLTNAYPSEILASIQPFAKIPNGIVAIEESKLLVVRDYAVNVKRMMEIIKRVDVIPEDDYVFKVIPIRYGTVEDVNNRFKEEKNDDKLFETSVLNFDWLNEK